MIKEKYRTDVDGALKSVFRKSATSLKTVNAIEFQEELVSSGAIKKMAFDVYRVDNDPYKSLWLLEEVEGKKYLVRAEDPVFASAEQGDWTAVSDYEHRNVTLAYKNVPIARFSSDSYGFSQADIGSFKTALLELASEDHSFVQEVLAEQPEDKRQALAFNFPELSKFI